MRDFEEMTIAASGRTASMQRIRAVVRSRALIPAWFVCIGLVGLAIPVPTVAIALTLLVMTVVIVPTLLITVEA